MVFHFSSTNWLSSKGGNFKRDPRACMYYLQLDSRSEWGEDCREKNYLHCYICLRERELLYVEKR